MWVMVAGRYSAPTSAERAANLALMVEAARGVYQRGHMPIIGLLAALPLFGEDTTDPVVNADVMRVSLDLTDRCDAILMISHSRGADAEMDRFVAAGKPVHERLDDLPEG